MVTEKVHVLLLILAPFFGYCFVLGVVKNMVDVHLAYPTKIFKNMESFGIESFVVRPTLSLLSLLKKPQLASHFKLSVAGSIKKGEIKRLITVYLRDEELVPKEDTVDSLPVTVIIDSSTLELKCLEF